MKKILLFFLLETLLFSSCQKEITRLSYTHPVPFAPETYLCYKARTPLKIDGKLEEESWLLAKPTANFVDIEGRLKPIPTYQTYVKMLWDEDYFYFGAYLEEPHIWATLTERDAVIFYDNDFEIFLDPDGDSHNYYEFEMNALNTVWDLLLLRPYREDGNPKVLDSWDIQGLKTGVYVNGTLNNSTDIDSFWTVEIAIPWKVLEEMTPESFFPKEHVQWRVNFSRVNWDTEIIDGNYQKKKDKNGKNLPEANWVWSAQGYINMHAPETWGIVQFSEYTVGGNKAAFVNTEEEKIKWALRQMYYQQQQFFKLHQQYTADLNAFTLPEISIQNYEFQPMIHLTYAGYEIIANSLQNEFVWIIQEDGRVYRTKHKKHTR